MSNFSNLIENEPTYSFCVLPGETVWFRHPRAPQNSDHCLWTVASGVVDCIELYKDRQFIRVTCECLNPENLKPMTNELAFTLDQFGKLFFTSFESAKAQLITTKTVVNQPMYDTRARSEEAYAGCTQKGWTEPEHLLHIRQQATYFHPMRMWVLDTDLKLRAPTIYELYALTCKLALNDLHNAKLPVSNTNTSDATTEPTVRRLERELNNLKNYVSVLRETIVTQSGMILPPLRDTEE